MTAPTGAPNATGAPDRPRILVVEDDEAIATGLALNLKLAGYLPIVVHDGQSGLDTLQSEHEHAIALMLLDLNLPSRDGLEVLSELRESGDATPVIVLSAREDEYDKVAALRIGADDYVTKPFSLAELLARVDAVLRRSASGVFMAAGVAQAGSGAQAAPAPSPIAIDVDLRAAYRDGDEVKLTPLEFDLLRFFLANPARVLTRDELVRKVWGQQRATLRTVDNFVAQLRAKFELDAEQPRHFVTVRGSGYRFDP